MFFRKLHAFIARGRIRYAVHKKNLVTAHPEQTGDHRLTLFYLRL